MTIQQRYDLACSIPRDIDQHLGTLLGLARQCDSVVEGGVRDVVSTWAFLLGCACRGGTVTSYDLVSCSAVTEAQAICQAEGVRWDFIESDWLADGVEIPECDLLFIDTLHTYAQCSRELTQLSPRCRRWIVLHDTVLFGKKGQDGSTPGLWEAVKELVAGGGWLVLDHCTRQNGLVTLERVP